MEIDKCTAAAAPVVPATQQTPPVLSRPLNDKEIAEVAGGPVVQNRNQ